MCLRGEEGGVKILLLCAVLGAGLLLAFGEFFYWVIGH